jgi:hypothetical protein
MMSDTLLPKALMDAIERQPPDIGGSHTWVCGCVEYQIDSEKSISLCNYHGGFEDALKLVADMVDEALAILNSTAYGYPQRVLQVSILLEQIKKDSVVNDG